MAKKSRIMWVRVTPSIDQYIRQKAEVDEVEIAEVIRRAILEYMFSHPLPEISQEKEETTHG